MTQLRQGISWATGSVIYLEQVIFNLLKSVKHCRDN